LGDRSHDDDADYEEDDMAIQIRYLPEGAIEKDAEDLLAEFAQARGITLKPPIPIDDIVGKHLKLRIDFDDLHQVLGVPQVGAEPDIFGALWVDRREIYIHESLDSPLLRWDREGYSRPRISRLIRQHLRDDVVQYVAHFFDPSINRTWGVRYLVRAGVLPHLPAPRLAIPRCSAPCSGCRRFV
jgi:hypothetical protein